MENKINMRGGIVFVGLVMPLSLPKEAEPMCCYSIRNKGYGIFKSPVPIRFQDNRAMIWEYYNTH